jgi:hypothetical protein
MNREEQLRRNNQLLGVFLQQVLDSPELQEQIPDNADLLFLPDNDEELRTANLQLAEELRGQGKEPVFVKVSFVTQTLTVLAPKMHLVSGAG